MAAPQVFSEGGGQSYIGVRFGAIIQDRRGNVKRRKPKTGARWRKIRSNDLQLKIVAFFGAVGGIRTLVPLLTTTRFPVVLVMTSSIPLHILFLLRTAKFIIPNF